MKRIIQSILIIFVLASTLNIAHAQKMAASVGLGITFPMGDLSDELEFPIIPLLASFQYAVSPFLSLEADSYVYLYSESEHSGVNYNQYQLGASVRYWLTSDWQRGNTFNGIYLGGGLARTRIEIESHEDSSWTLVLKGGYLLPLKSVILDLGLRYDAVSFEDWFDQGLTAYAMAMYLF